MLNKKTIQMLLKLLEEEESQRKEASLLVQENFELINRRLHRIESLLFKIIQSTVENGEKKQETKEQRIFDNKATEAGRLDEILISGNLLVHPSHERFSSLRSLAEGNYEICPLEPTPKPCDRCLMCSCRGF
jgi:hypothetical protein